MCSYYFSIAIMVIKITIKKKRATCLNRMNVGTRFPSDRGRHKDTCQDVSDRHGSNRSSHKASLWPYSHRVFIHLPSIHPTLPGSADAHQTHQAKATGKPSGGDCAQWCFESACGKGRGVSSDSDPLSTARKCDWLHQMWIELEKRYRPKQTTFYRGLMFV